jgi:metal-dependent HD superfamily phosphatase/phosphodiesterase
MIDVKTLDRSDQIKLIMELERALGWYPVVTLDVEDLRERFVDQELTVPPAAILHQACDYVYRKNYEESSHLLEWAQEVAEEILSKEQTA